MREIKFRAWDGKAKEIVPIYGTNDVDHLTSTDNWQVMQFTGLKDKNGIEIYEGDIVEHRNYIQELLGKYEVRWGNFGFTLWDKNQPDILSHYISPDQLEVVGDIYE